MIFPSKWSQCQLQKKSLIFLIIIIIIRHASLSVCIFLFLLTMFAPNSVTCHSPCTTLLAYKQGYQGARYLTQWTSKAPFIHTWLTKKFFSQLLQTYHAAASSVELLPESLDTECLLRSELFKLSLLPPATVRYVTHKVFFKQTHFSSWLDISDLLQDISLKCMYFKLPTVGKINCPIVGYLKSEPNAYFTSGRQYFHRTLRHGVRGYKQLTTGPPRQAPVHSFFRLKPLMKRPTR